MTRTFLHVFMLKSRLWTWEEGGFFHHHYFLVEENLQTYIDGGYLRRTKLRYLQYQLSELPVS